MNEKERRAYLLIHRSLLRSISVSYDPDASGTGDLRLDGAAIALLNHSLDAATIHNIAAAGISIKLCQAPAE